MPLAVPARNRCQGRPPKRTFGSEDLRVRGGRRASTPRLGESPIPPQTQGMPGEEAGPGVQ
eukprot:11031679-Alexandrium_andersonii.AAC.1